MKKLFILCMILMTNPLFSQDNATFYSKLLHSIPRWVGKKHFVLINNFKYNEDCSGFIAFVFHSAGLNLLKLYAEGRNGVTAIWNGMQKNNFIVPDKNLQVGDIVFFDNTYDQNKNGQWDDALSHIGVVESVDERGTITYVHYASRGVVRSKMNLQYPETYALVENGTSYRYNDVLRNSTIRGIHPKHLSGALYRGAARITVKKKLS